MMILSHSLIGQTLIKSGKLEPIIYEFKGPEQYHLKGDLCHAMAYTYNKDIGDVYASLSYSIKYEVYKISGMGFETIITFLPSQKEGHYQLYDFDFSKEIFPMLAMAQLSYTKEEKYIYVKPITLKDSLKDCYSFVFKHQRFSQDWTLNLKDIQWQERYNKKTFNKRWALINDYRTTNFWMANMDLFISFPNEPWGNQIHNIRWLSIFDQIKQMEFYQKLILSDGLDPQFLEKKIDIETYVMERDTEVFKKEREAFNADIKNICEAYFELEIDLLFLAETYNFLYSDLYFDFDASNTKHFCLDETHEILQESQLDSAIYYFEHSIQDQSIQLITQLIEEKKAKEALFQIKRFQQFHLSSQYLNKSARFFQFKAKAVYDIYLSYIQVSRQALEHNQIDLAINYLDNASKIQEQYPSEIINNLQVENQLKELVKKGMIRYQYLLDNKEFETAKRVKEGLLGLMKKLGMNEINLHFKPS